MTPQAHYNASYVKRSTETPDYYHTGDHQHSVRNVESALDHAGQSSEPLRVHVERVVRQYFSVLGDDIPTDLYELILKEVEQPLLSVVLEKSRGNQTKCAQILGLNRGTLRKKLKTYGLM